VFILGDKFTSSNHGFLEGQKKKQKGKNSTNQTNFSLDISMCNWEKYKLLSNWNR